jgi:hypothetical protein
MTAHVCTNLFHDVITDCSATGVLHLANKAPAGWCSKKQVAVKTVTHGSQFITTCITTEQIIDLRPTSHCLGAPAMRPLHKAQWDSRWSLHRFASSMGKVRVKQLPVVT